jgi:hypothetical protein
VLPGAYINFVSLAHASPTLADRGIATLPIILPWGTLGEVLTVSAGEFQRDSMKIFGYPFTAPELKPLRDLFRNIRLAFLYRLGTGGTRATNTFGTARCPGTRGNALMVVIRANVDNSTLFDVELRLDGAVVDLQTVANAAALVNNEFVTWNTGATLALTAGTPMTTGANPTIADGNYQTYLDLMEGYSFNAMGCPSSSTTVKNLFAAYTRRLRDDQGIKFQCVIHNPTANSDFEGVVDVMNDVTDPGADVLSMIFYDGEYTVDVNFTQLQLENAIRGGKFAFYRHGQVVRVLDDINSLVTTTLEKSDDFKQNQTIRVLDQIANDIANLFNTRYLGQVPNDQAGRISLWADIVRHHEQLQEIRAIQEFADSNLVNSAVMPVSAMAQLYMTVWVE